ncbi:MAG: ribonuclease D [Caldilineaceae bacterium]|nr:ribonuclease D [Caldilineaceae bacterium]
MSRQQHSRRQSGRNANQRGHSSQAQNVSPNLIYTGAGLAQMCESLQNHTLIAVDTESDSLFSYYPKVCLIQLSVYADPKAPDAADVVDYLVDPLRLERLDPLATLLADSGIEVVMHAAENDILTLQRDFQLVFTNIFDTQLAARILGWNGIGLAAILEKQFGLVSDKRMQRTNWGARPLTPQQIAYAQMDTHYLPALRERQIQELTAMNRLEEAREAFSFLAKLDYAERPTAERTFWSMKIARKVPTEHTGILEALWEWREHEAQQQNKPPFKIVNDNALAAIADARPETQGELDGIGGISSYQARRYGSALLATVQAGVHRPLPKPPENNHHRPEAALSGIAQVRYEALRRWRAKIARQRGVNPDIVFTNSTLMTIAQRHPRSVAELESIPEIGPWKAKTYGPDVLPLVRGKVK